MTEKFRGEWLNEKPWDHVCHNGTEFSSSRCDFEAELIARVPARVTEEELMQDVSEMIGYHAMNIHPHLNGFRGYDCIRYVIERT